MATKTSTSVHTIETSGKHNLPDRYQDYRRSHCELEYAQTAAMYSRIDSLMGSHYAEQLDQCRSYAWFTQHTETGDIRIASNACRLRWCPICSSARSRFIVSSVQDWLNKHPRSKFLTLTYEHSSAPLLHQINSLYSHFRQFRKRKYIRKKIAGGIWFFQVKKSEISGEWHPHIHCVIDAPYIPQKSLSQEWLKTTLTSYIVDIRPIRNRDEVADYVARYCSRPAGLKDFAESDQVDIFHAMHGRRLCGTWGTGREASLRPKGQYDSSEWRKIGGYKEILSAAGNNAIALSVLQSFINNDPLDYQITREQIFGGEIQGLCRVPSDFVLSTFFGEETEFR